MDDGAVSYRRKRYQVFVSSTFEDLQEERQEIMQALLELDCIPAGMELFPAASEDQWTLIKRVIDECDYYIVIIGGRYGSLGPEGLSYTEMEYRYALELDKPTIAFLHKHPETLPANRTEVSAKGKAKLKAFRELTQQKYVQYWTSPAELGGRVSRSMIKLIQTTPAVGWVRADEASVAVTRELSDVDPADKQDQQVDVAQEILNLSRRIAELQPLLSAGLRIAELPSPDEDTKAEQASASPAHIGAEHENVSRRRDLSEIDLAGTSEIIWDAILLLEEAQRVLFRHGDRYVSEVWSEGVRAVIELTERIADISGDLTTVHIDIGRIAKREQARTESG